MPDRPGYSFDPGPPPEASRFLRNKGLQPAFSWMDVEPEEHAVAFSVAKAMQTDVLSDIRDEVQRALDEGRTLAQFKRDLKPKLVEKGWWGVSEMTDPDTGELRQVQLGSPRRLRTIYRSNLRSARAAGQWERIQRTKDALPYLLYQLGPSERHRPEHRAKNGLVLAADDPFWAQWYPPNGWGCKCWVRQLTRAQAEQRGIGVAPGVPGREWRNPRTGEVRRVPAGIDPAWVGNPGAYRQRRMEELLAGRLEAADPPVARVIARDIASSWRAQRVLEGAADGAVPIAVIDAPLADALGTTARVIRMTNRYGEKVSDKNTPASPDVLARLAEAAFNGTATSHVDKQGVRVLTIYTDGDDPWRMVVKVLVQKGEMWVRTIHRTDPERWKKDARRLEGKILRK